MTGKGPISSVSVAMPARHLPLVTAAGYAVVGSLWILFSDLVVSWLVKDPAMITRVQTLKGWLFIIVTALLLLLILSTAMRTIRRSQQALHESEERFRLLIERMTDYEIFMLDPAGNVMSWNLAAELNKGYRAEEVIGKHHSIFFTPEDIKDGLPEQELLSAAMANRFEDEGWRVRKDGSRFWANVVTAPLRDEQGVLRGYTKVIRDLTLRKRAEDALRESEERHRVIAETASDAIITIDSTGIIRFVNPAVETIFGYAPDALIGSPMTELIPERLREPHLNGIQLYLETGRRRMNWKAVELSALHKDGREIPVEVSYGDFMKDGQRFFTGIVRDISDRREAEKEREYKKMLEQFNREIETLVSERTMNLMALTLADRVRNPAAVIGWTCRKIIGRGSPELRESLVMIETEAARLEATVKDFQSALKRTASMFSYEDVNEILRDLTPMLKNEADAKGVALSLTLVSRPLKINAQKDLMRIAVFNLLRNAIEATPAGGSVSISAEEEDGSVILSVADSGDGIPADISSKIFDPLFSTKEYRYGMGLPLVKQIVSEHLGRIEVKSEIGKGTTFRLVFPARWTDRPQAS